MRQGFLTVVLSAAVLCAAVPIYNTPAEQIDYAMSTIAGSHPAAEEETSLALVNGDLAGDSTPQVLTKGPKVNGAMADIIIEHKKDPNAPVANADCAGGHYVHGKCLHPFPRNARTANIDDNMESPEQHSEAGYEPDIHSFVRKHFGTTVMTEANNYEHASLPGFAIVDYEMNKEGNKVANEMAEDLIPLGTQMMAEGNRETDVKFNQPDMNIRHHYDDIDNHHINVPEAGSSPKIDAVGYVPPVHRSHDASNTNTSPSYTTSPSGSGAPHAETMHDGANTQTTQSQGEGSYTQVQGPNSQNEGNHPYETVNTDVALGEKNTEPSFSYTPSERPILVNGNEEVALEPHPLNDVEDEFGDQESSIPHQQYDSEASLPPTPTPTPTPNVEEIERVKREKEARLLQVDTCISLLEKENIQCSNIPKETELMYAGSLVQATAQTRPSYSSNDVRENFQTLLQDCTSKTALSLTGVEASALSLRRAEFTQSLVKYASAMSCVDSAEFPSCLPTEVAASLQKPASQWSCF